MLAHGYVGSQVALHLRGDRRGHAFGRYAARTETADELRHVLGLDAGEQGIARTARVRDHARAADGAVPAQRGRERVDLPNANRTGNAGAQRDRALGAQQAALEQIEPLEPRRWMNGRRPTATARGVEAVT